MKNLLGIFVSLFMGLCITHPALSQDNHYVHCILLDRTLSMTGSGGGQNIWPNVQEYCYSWVDGIKIPSTIVFFTYARDLSNPQIFEIRTEADKSNVRNAVKNVTIDGRHTWIASNLAKAWDYLCRNYSGCVKKVYLITDGKEEEMNSSIGDVIEKYDATRGDYDYLYYVDLNDNASNDTKDAIAESDGAGLGKGFLKSYTFSPSFPDIEYTIGGANGLVQLFTTGSKDISECSFTAKVKTVTSIDDQPSRSPNVRISPETVYVKDLPKDGDKYQYDFNVIFYNNSETPCDITIKLEGSTTSGDYLDFIPADFKIKVRNVRKEDVHPKGNGWRIK